MKTNELYIKYADVIKLCIGTKLENDPWVCIKMDGGEPFFEETPSFDNDPGTYEFAVAILEDRPVFVGDSLFNDEGFEYIVSNDANRSVFFKRKNDVIWHSTISKLAWQPPAPKRTFSIQCGGMLSGMKIEDLPCPIVSRLNKITLYISAGANGKRSQSHVFAFSSEVDLEKVTDGIVDILNKARDQ